MEANRSGAALVRYGFWKLYRLSALLAQRHHDGRVALHRLLHDRRGAEAAPDDLVAAECVHVDNPEIDALTCRRYGMLCIAIAGRNILVVTQYHDSTMMRLSRKPTEARLYRL